MQPQESMSLPLFRETKSTVLKKAKKIHALTLKGFAGLVGREIQPERRLGSEMSDYAKKCGVGGIFHTDELPAYGVTAEEVLRLRSHMDAGEQDCVVLVAGANEKQAACAINQVIIRAQLALSDKPVPEETTEDAREREHGLHAPAARGSPDVPGDRCTYRS